MASIRKFKKVMDYMVSDLVIDCFQYVSLYDSPESEKAFKIIEKVLMLRNDLRNEINSSFVKQDSSMTKSNFRKVNEKLTQGLEKGYEELGSLIESKT